MLAKVKAGSDENTHPEVFIRAKALDLYQQETLDLTQIKTLVCDQQQLITLTQDFFDLYGSQKLAQTEAVETHIKRFFSDFSGFKIPTPETTKQFKKQIKANKSNGCQCSPPQKTQ